MLFPLPLADREVFCGALDLLRPISSAANARDQRLWLSLQGDHSTLYEGDFLRPQIIMPNFSGQIRVDYVATVGSISHLYPTIGEKRAQLIAVAPRMLGSGESLTLGNDDNGRPIWEVGPPFGTDMVVVVASSIPLFQKPRPTKQRECLRVLSRTDATNSCCWTDAPRP
jgi:hypothetical protein